MSISTNDLKNGMALNLPSEGLVTVVEFQHVKPGKGGAFVRTKLKKVAGGAVLERTFRADEKVPLAVIDKREMQYLYREGDSLVLGEKTPGETSFHVLETPGHTQGSISLWIPAENKLVAGDTLFRDSIGRTDLPGGDTKQILRSIHTKLLTLPESAVVIPGHGPNTTIGREKERNPFLRGR